MPYILQGADNTIYKVSLDGNLEEIPLSDEQAGYIRGLTYHYR